MNELIQSNLWFKWD